MCRRGSDFVMEYMRMHVLDAGDVLATLDSEKTNVGRISFTSGGERYVVVLSRSDLETLALQIQQLCDPAPPLPPRRKGRKS
jgi:hypothetical protein